MQARGPAVPPARRVTISGEIVWTAWYRSRLVSVVDTFSLRS